MRTFFGRIFGIVKRFDRPVRLAVYRWRRGWFVLRVRAKSLWHRSKTAVDVARDVRFGRKVEVRVWPETVNEIRIGPGCLIEDHVLIILKDGRFLLGDNVEVRRDTIFNLWGGRLELAGDQIISWGNVFHCASSIRFGRLSSTNEWVTVVDSSHYFTEPDAFFYHNTKTGPIEVGYNTWICSKATLARNTTVGDHCIVAGNSIVTGDVPSGHLVSGVPATVVRTLPLPWKETARERAAGAATPYRASSSS